MATDPDVRIHIAQLDAFDPSIGIDWLTSDEAARLRAMTAPQRRRSFIAGHWLARHAAGEWLDLDPRQVAVRHHADGRPYLHVDASPGNNIIDIMRSSDRRPLSAPQPLRTPSLCLSISHSGDWLAVAVANMPIGVDIEMSGRNRNFEALARFAFSPEEAARISALDATQRATAFHQLWTLKEARGKRIGEGFLPEQSRKLTATAASAEQAEAISWAFQEGSLALAFDPGSRIDAMRIEFANEPEPAGRTYWDFRQS